MCICSKVYTLISLLFIFERKNYFNKGLEHEIRQNCELILKERQRFKDKPNLRYRLLESRSKIDPSENLHYDWGYYGSQHRFSRTARHHSLSFDRFPFF